MDNKLIGVLITLSLLIGAGGGSLIFDTDKPLYVCESKDLISDCINGVKADGQRCYYNATNARKYSYCAEGWQPFDQGAMIDKTGPIASARANSDMICYPDKCVPAEQI